MLKKITIVSGVFFILLALITIIPNNLVGNNALLETDFLRNLIHLFVGGFLIFVAIWHSASILRLYRILGYSFICLAVLGAWSTGYDIGKLLGIMTTNGASNIFNLVVGVYYLVIGTSELRDGQGS